MSYGSEADEILLHRDPRRSSGGLVRGERDDGGGLRVVAVVGPCLHELPALLKHVRSQVGSFRLAVQRVG